MKLWMWWTASAVWALYFALMGLRQFQEAWGADGSFLAFLNVLTVGDKLETFLSGIGAWALGAMPLYVTNLVQRFRNSRERHRLEKERERIDKRIEKLDREKDVLTPAGPSLAKTSAAPAESVAASVSTADEPRA